MDDQKIQDETREIILDELGLSGVSPEKQNEILAKVGEIIIKRAFVEVLKKLSDDERRKFVELLDKEDGSQELEIFLANRVKDYDKIVDGIVSELKGDIKKDLNNN